MIVLSRRAGEAILIGEEIRVTVISLNGDRIRLGIEAPVTAASGNQNTGDERQTREGGGPRGESAVAAADTTEPSQSRTAEVREDARTAVADAAAVPQPAGAAHSDLLARLQRFRHGWRSVWRRIASRRLRRTRPGAAQEPENMPEDLFFG